MFTLLSGSLTNAVSRFLQQLMQGYILDRKEPLYGLADEIISRKIGSFFCYIHQPL